MGEHSSLERARRALATAAPHVRRAVRKNRALLALVAIAGFTCLSAPPLAAHVLPGTPVVVAAHAIAAGETLDDSDLTTVMVRPDLIPAGASRQPHELVGESTAGTINQGDLVLRENLREAAPSLDPEHALVSIPIAPGSVVEGAEAGTQLRLVCERPSSSIDADRPATLSEVRAVLRESHGSADSSGTMFAASGSPTATVEIDRAHISTIAHCTSGTPPFVAVVR